MKIERYSLGLREGHGVMVEKRQKVSLPGAYFPKVHSSPKSEGAESESDFDIRMIVFNNGYGES